MSYQPPAGDKDDAAARQPPGWYLDPTGQQALRWWDGAQWGQQTQPLPGRGQKPPIMHPQQPGPPSGHHERPPRKSWPQRHKVLTVLGGLVALGIIGSIASAAGGGNHAAPSTPAAAASSPTAAASTSAPSTAPAATARTVATFSGSGQKNTPRFTVTDTWKLVYNFNCSSFGSSGNFQVYEDGGKDFNLSVNDLAMSKSSSTWAYNDSGTHYLEINSECSWNVKVVDEP